MLHAFIRADHTAGLWSFPIEGIYSHTHIRGTSIDMHENDINIIRLRARLTSENITSKRKPERFRHSNDAAIPVSRIFRAVILNNRVLGEWLVTSDNASYFTRLSDEKRKNVARYPFAKFPVSLSLFPSLSPLHTFSRSLSLSLRTRYQLRCLRVVRPIAYRATERERSCGDN